MRKDADDQGQAPSASQTASHLSVVGCAAATRAANSAVAPMAIPPKPGTAVNDAAPSIVSRM